MTPASPGASMTVLFDREMHGWLFGGVPTGPAGAISVLLDDDVRLSVDAAEPAVLIEVAVAAGTDGEVTPAAAELIRRLLGQQAADVISASQETAATSITMSGDNAVLTSASALAVAESTARRQAAPRLRDLDVALHANRIGHPTTTADASRAAWAVLPAAVALARACETYPAMLAAVPEAALGELRSRLLVLLHLVERDDPSIVDTVAHRMVSGLAERTRSGRLDLLDVDVEASLAALDFDHDSRPVLDLSPSGARVHKGSADVAPRTMRWTGDVADFASRLGAEMPLLHPGQIVAWGQAPGELTVTVPVALGVRTEDLVDLRVRAMTDAGHVLDESSVEVGREPDRLPVGIARLALPDTARGLTYDGIVIDIAGRGTAAPDAAGLRRLDRLRATRCGQEAVACAAAGDHRTSAQLWRDCANRLEALGEDELSARARVHADRADDRSDGSGPDRQATEWLTALLTGWSAWALTELGRIDASEGDPGPIGALRELVDRLAGWNDPSAEIAQARLALGLALRAAPPDTGEPDEADHQIREAMRTFYDLGDNAQALACLRELGSRAGG